MIASVEPLRCQPKKAAPDDAKTSQTQHPSHQSSGCRLVIATQ